MMWSGGALCQLSVLVFASAQATPTVTSTAPSSSSSSSSSAAAVPAFVHHANLVPSRSTLGRFASTLYGGDSAFYSSFSTTSSSSFPLPQASSLGLKASTTGSMESESLRRRRAGEAATAIASGARMLGTVMAAKKENEEPYSPPAPRSPRTPPADSSRGLPAAALCRGGGGVDGTKPKSRGLVTALKVVRGGTTVLDKVEDVLGGLAGKLGMALFPLFHLGRLGFGLSLLFYGMAFQTFAFHVIVFRIAGFKQLRGSMLGMVSSYRRARSSIREAASAAGSVGDRVIRGDNVKAARDAMIAEKKRLLSNGYLSTEDTRYFMEKYNTELMEIKAEQDRFKSARSSIFSVKNSVDPGAARAGLTGLYSALVASFTASSIETAGQITLGLHVGTLLKTHILDLFGPILDPIGYRLDLDTYYDENDIPYMGKANAMDGPSNMFLNIFCYGAVFLIIRVHPSAALKGAMVYYGARVVTDYLIVATQLLRKRLPRNNDLEQMTIIHTPWSAVVHTVLTALGYYFHRNIVHTAGTKGLLLFGPGAVGLVEPFVRVVVKMSEMLHNVDFFKVKIVSDPMETVKAMAQRVK